jgi:hypothetical protein
LIGDEGENVSIPEASSSGIFTDSSSMAALTATSRWSATIQGKGAM